MTDHEWPSRYADYLGPEPRWAEGAPPPTTHTPPKIFINVSRHDQLWSAVWQSSDGLLGSFEEGTREDAIAWARARCDTVFIFSPELGDLVPLEQTA